MYTNKNYETETFDRLFSDIDTVERRDKKCFLTKVTTHIEQTSCRTLYEFEIFK